VLVSDLQSVNDIVANGHRVHGVTMKMNYCQLHST